MGDPSCEALLAIRRVAPAVALGSISALSSASLPVWPVANLSRSDLKGAAASTPSRMAAGCQPHSPFLPSLSKSTAAGVWHPWSDVVFWYLNSCFGRAHVQWPEKESGEESCPHILGGGEVLSKGSASLLSLGFDLKSFHPAPMASSLLGPGSLMTWSRFRWLVGGPRVLAEKCWSAPDTSCVPRPGLAPDLQVGWRT